MGLQQTRTPSCASSSLRPCLPKFGSPDHSGPPGLTRTGVGQALHRHWMGSYFRSTLISTRARRAGPPTRTKFTHRMGQHNHVEFFSQRTFHTARYFWTPFPSLIGLHLVVARSNFRHLLPNFSNPFQQPQGLLVPLHPPIICGAKASLVFILCHVARPLHKLILALSPLSYLLFYC